MCTFSKALSTWRREERLNELMKHANSTCKHTYRLTLILQNAYRLQDHLLRPQRSRRLREKRAFKKEEKGVKIQQKHISLPTPTSLHAYLHHKLKPRGMHGLNSEEVRLLQDVCSVNDAAAAHRAQPGVLDLDLRRFEGRRGRERKGEKERGRERKREGGGRE